MVSYGEAHDLEWDSVGDHPEDSYQVADPFFQVSQEAEGHLEDVSWDPGQLLFPGSIQQV